MINLRELPPLKIVGKYMHTFPFEAGKKRDKLMNNNHPPPPPLGTFNQNVDVPDIRASPGSALFLSGHVLMSYGHATNP